MGLVQPPSQSRPRSRGPWRSRPGEKSTELPRLDFRFRICPAVPGLRSDDGRDNRTDQDSPPTRNPKTRSLRRLNPQTSHHSPRTVPVHPPSLLQLHARGLFALGHANLQTTAIYTTAAGIEALIFWPGCGKERRIRPDPAPEGLRRRPVARIPRVVARKVGPPCELQTLLEPKKDVLRGIPEDCGLNSCPVPCGCGEQPLKTTLLQEASRPFRACQALEGQITPASCRRAATRRNSPFQKPHTAVFRGFRGVRVHPAPHGLYGANFGLIQRSAGPIAVAACNHRAFCSQTSAIPARINCE